MSVSVPLEIPPELVELIARRAAELVETRPSDDGWMDARAAADYLALPRSTLHKLTAAREIPFSQDGSGGKLYFKRSALDAWRSSR
jgi:excisionase family DNA binding protein